MLPDLERILELLTDQQIRFVLIGGVAMALHGSAHVTQDIDICYARDDGNLELLAQALAPRHPSLRNALPDLPFRLDVRTLKMANNFTLATDLGDVDLLRRGAGVWERGTPVRPGRIEVRVASLSDLIAMSRRPCKRSAALH